MVVWVEAAAEESTMSNNRWSRIEASVEWPKIAGPRTESTSPTLAELPEPDPDCADPGEGLRRRG